MQASPATATLPHNSLEVLLALSMAAVIAIGFALVAGALTRRLLLSIEGERFHTKSIADRTVGVVRRLTFAIALLALVFPALDFAGVDIAVGLRDEDLAQWFARTGVRVLLLLLLAFAANRFAGSVIRRAEHEVVQTGETQGFDPSTLREPQGRPERSRGTSKVEGRQAQGRPERSRGANGANARKRWAPRGGVSSRP